MPSKRWLFLFYKICTCALNRRNHMLSEQRKKA
nr:MAG TPA: hypothetical protein [Caudoviricetes sp.]